MGGRGSGRRPSDHRTTLGDLYRVDLRYLRQQGWLRPGASGALRWSRCGQEIGWLGFAVGDDELRLIYRVRADETAAWEPVDDPVRLVRTAQPFGGARVWLGCPGCGRRCVVLYGGRRFRCRRCVGVAYASQHEAAHERLMHRAQDIRERLGGRTQASLALPFPPKPPRMRWRTYRRLRAEAERCTRASLVAAVARFGMPLGELEDLLL
jgi:hypothetical protein